MNMDDVRLEAEKKRVDNNHNAFAHLLTKLPEEKINPSEKNHIIKCFVDEINKERVGTKYPPTKGKREAIMLNTVYKTIGEFRRFWSECKDYQNRGGSFGRRFYGGFKKQGWQEK